MCSESGCVLSQGIDPLLLHEPGEFRAPIDHVTDDENRGRFDAVGLNVFHNRLERAPVGFLFPARNPSNDSDGGIERLSTIDEA